MADIREEEKAPPAYEVAGPPLRTDKTALKREFAKVALQTRRDEVRESARQAGHRLGAWVGTTAAKCKRCGCVVAGPSSQPCRP